MIYSHSLTFLLFFDLGFPLSITSFVLTQVYPSHIVSDRIKFWLENVYNQMLESVFRKLSPLTKRDRDSYTRTLMSPVFIYLNINSRNWQYLYLHLTISVLVLFNNFVMVMLKLSLHIINLLYIPTKDDNHESKIMQSIMINLYFPWNFTINVTAC